MSRRLLPSCPPNEQRGPQQSGPYRVGMTRAPQRYIEPDEIYEDMNLGPHVEMPREFPYTWNPVNGLGSTSGGGRRRRVNGGSVDGFFDDLVSAAKGVVASGSAAAADPSGAAVQSFINSPAGQQLLNKVQDKAAAGVTNVVKQQGVNLIVLGVAAGAIGGAFAARFGKLGTLIALAGGGLAIAQIMNATAPPPSSTGK